MFSCHFCYFCSKACTRHTVIKFFFFFFFFFFLCFFFKCPYLNCHVTESFHILDHGYIRGFKPLEVKVWDTSVKCSYAAVVFKCLYLDSQSSKQHSYLEHVHIHAFFIPREVGWGVGVTRKILGRGCAAGTLNTPPIQIISRLTKHTYSYEGTPYSNNFQTDKTYLFI